MIDTFAIVVPFVLVSGFLKKVIAYAEKKNRPTHGWFVAMMAAVLCLITIILVRLFPTADNMATLEQTTKATLILFAGAVMLRPVLMDFEIKKLSAKLFYPAVYVLCVAGLFLMVPEGFYKFESQPLIWAERLSVALAWLGFSFFMRNQDAAEGSVALQAMIICIGLSIVAKNISLYALIIAGCCMGFMRFNWPGLLYAKLKTHMGLTGSFWLGFVLFGLAVLALTLPNTQGQVPCLTLLTLFLLPTVDGLQASLRSMMKKTPAMDNTWSGRLIGGGMQASGVMGRTVGLHFLLFLAAILGYVAHHSLYTLLFGMLVLLLHHVRVGQLCTVINSPKRARK